jgi:hypothetical protein
MNRKARERRHFIHSVAELEEAGMLWKGKAVLYAVDSLHG